MILGKTPRQHIMLNINQIKVEEYQKVVLLGITLDNRLIFKDHADMLCSTVNYNIRALRRIRKYLTPKKAKLLYNDIQFNYASVIWKFCREKGYLKIEKIRLKFIYNSSEFYEELLTLSNEVSIHQKHLRALATEIYKSLADISQDLMKPFFVIKEMPYNLRNGCTLKLLSANSTNYGTNSVLFRACLLWNRLPLSIKS